MKMLSHCATAAALFAFCGMDVANADPVADFFRNKHITIVVGYGPGGGYDVYTRLLTRHMGRHIPGNPRFIIQHMPGAGSLRAANHIANVAPKDGTTLGVFGTPAAIEPLFRNPNAQFDPVKFNWIGNMYSDVASCVTWHNSPIKNLQQIIESKTEVVFGATGPGSYGNQHALILKNMLGANLKVITGFKGMKDVGLALQRGELHAACAMALSTAKAAFSSNVKNGELKFLVQFGKVNEPYFGDAPNFYAMLKTDEQRQIADLFFNQLRIGRPLIGPPGMPQSIVTALRKAMEAALNDQALIEEAGKIGVDIKPMSGQEVQVLFADFFKASPEVIAKAMAIIGRR